MNQKHSLLTRCLAVLLALVLIVSNANIGLATLTLAAERSESLHELIADSTCGTAALRAILAAGGVPGDVEIVYSEPVTADAKDLLQLKGGTLTAKTYDANHNGLVWTPYSYGETGTENLFNGVYTVEWAGDDVTVVYCLNLGEAVVEAAMAQAAALANEAAAQDAILSNIHDNYQDNLKQLRKSTLNGLADEIDYVNTSAEVKAEFKAIIAELKKCIDDGEGGTGRLTFYNTLESYNAEGLVHYYQNSATYLSEIETLSGHLNALVDSEEKIDAMKQIAVNLDYDADYTDKIVVLAEVMDDANKNLTAPNAAIDVNNTALVKAMEAAGTVAAYPAGELCLYSTNLYVLDSTWAYVIASVNAGNKTVDVYEKVENGSVLTQGTIDAVIAKAQATAASLLGEKAAYYELDTAELEALVGKTVSGNMTAECTWNAKEYTVKINGEADQTVTINALTVTLPAHTQPGHIYTYVIGGTIVNAGEYTFTAAQLDELFVDGVYTIDRIHINQYKDDLEALIIELNGKLGKNSAFVLVKDEEEDYCGIVANIDINDLVTFAETVVTSEYGYLGLNNEVFYDGEYISLQALIDAILNDSEFNTDTLITLGKEGKGQLLHTTMQLPGYDDLDFVLNLTDVPEQMEIAAKGLSAIKDYVYFTAGNGRLELQLNLPEKVYEAYLTAALAAGRIDEDNVAALTNGMAMRFVADYFEMLMASDVDTATFTNTLKMLGIDRDLTGFEDYYQTIKNFVNGEGFEYTIGDNILSVSVACNSKNVENVMNLIGISTTNIKKGMSAIKKETLHAEAALVLNEVPDFQALVVVPSRINDNGLKNKINTIDYTTNLIGDLNSVEGSALVVLLDDVNGSLNFPGSVVLDLNGNTVNGNITASGKAVIVDSALDTYNGGRVTGTVTAAGGAITGGTFGGDVSAFLKDGYMQDNGSVRNALYYVVNDNGVHNFVLNADFYQSCEGYLPSVKALAVELASDLAVNFYPAVALNYNSNPIFSLNIDAILNTYLDNTKAGAVDELITDMVNSVHADGINALANDIIDDLCDFKALAAALNNGEPLCTYNFSFNPLTVDFTHVTNGDYIDFSLVADTDYVKNFNVAITVEGENDYITYAKKLLTAMAEIVTVDAGVELEQPTYDAATNTLSVAGSAFADVVIDFSGNSDYTKGIAIILAYGNEEWADELMNAKNCVVVLNSIIEQMTIEDVFTALKIMSRDVSMTEMADAVGYKYNAEEIAALEDVYHVLLCGLGKVLEELDITGNNNALSAYANGEATYTYGRNVDRSGDASFRGYTGVYDVTSVDVSVSVKLAPKCTKVLGDADWDGEVTTFDAALILEYKAELVDETGIHLCVCDVDGVGEITTFDAATILEYKAELIDRFPAEEN